MARKKKRRSPRSAVADKCKTYTIRGKRRTLCFGRNGKIKSNRASR